MARVRTVILCALLGTGSVAGPASAQSRWSVTPYAGVLFTDDDLAGEGGPVDFLDDPSLPPGPRSDVRLEFEVENAPVFGARLGIPLDERWGIEASYGFASFQVRGEVEVTSPFPELDEESVRFGLAISDHDLHLWEGAVRYSFGNERLRPFLVGGVGGATVSSSFPIFGGLEELDETTTDLAFVLGAGARWDYREGFGIRLDLRDHLQRCDRPCLGDETLLHQVELSAGIEIEL